MNRDVSGWPEGLVERLRAAKRVVVLTGAGVSAESGVPTFRDAQTGLWARYRAEDLATPEAFERDPDLVWRWYAWRRRLVAAAEPNAAHHALVRMEHLVPEFVLVTQNVDGLHARAGSRRLIELHGDIRRTVCAVERVPVELPESCEDRSDLVGTGGARGGRDLSSDALSEGSAGTGSGGPAGEGEAAPVCPRCGARLRPDVVWFGEALPEAALREAMAAAARCDVLLSVGTSGLVVPAAWLVPIARDAGAHVVVINTDVTAAGGGDVQVTGRAAEVLPALVEGVWPGAGG